MLSITIYRQLSSLVSKVHVLLARVDASAPADEVALRVTEIRQALGDLQENLSAESTGAFNALSRHLYWLERYHREQKPERYAPDIVDIRERDLPGVIAAVESWGHQILDTGLLEAIKASWEARHFGSAIRDAFIYLEDVLRKIGSVDPAIGLSGNRLVTHVLGPSSSSAITLPTDGFMGHFTRGELDGVYNYVKGAFLLFRNATAHRPIPYTAAEAEDIIHVVNLCLRMLPVQRTPV